MTRLTSATLALVFLAALGGDVYGYHDCAHHDHGGEVAAAPDASATAAPHLEAQHPAPGPAGVERAGASPPDSEGHPEGPSTCVGACHAGASAPVMAATPVAMPAHSAAAFRQHLSQPERQLPPEPSPYVLFFANAPPRLT